MVEEVHTGGLKKFVRGKEPKIEPELASKIEQAYEKAEIRKAKERRNRIITFIIILLLIIISIYLIFK